MKSLRNARLITAIKTPYTVSGEIDLQAYDALVQYQIDNAVDGIVVGGTTGEGHLMAWSELITLIGHSVNRFGDKLAIVGNTGSNNTREAVSETKDGFAVGMHAALQVNPYYGRTTPEGLLAHFDRVLECGPTILYNVPARTCQDMTPDIVESLAQHQHFVGIKECTGLQRIAGYTAKGIRVWSGNDSDFFDAMKSAGAFGAISVASNIAPGLMRRAVHDLSDVANEELGALISWLSTQPNPIPVNTALAMIGSCKPVFRLPYVPLDSQARVVGAGILLSLKDKRIQELGVRILGDDEFVIL